MSINITKEIEAGYEAYLNQQIDADVTGAPILRRDTYPYVGGHTGIVDFAAGWQAALSAGQATEPVAAAMVVAGRIDPMFGFDVLSNDGELLYLRSPEQTGWKLAPIEPTDDMAVAGQEAWLVCRTERPAVEDCEEARNVYRAMLLAAPTLGDQG